MNEEPKSNAGDCDRFEKLIEEYLAGDIAPADLETLRRHSAACHACRELMELHAELSDIPERVQQPSEHDFSDMRASVLSRIRTTGAGRRESAQPYPSRRAPMPMWKRWQTALIGRPAYSAAFAIVLLAVGFFLGRLGTGQAEFDEDLLVEEVVRQASLERGLDGYWDSPFIYSNVSFHQRTNGTVRLDFDVTRHVSVTRPLDSPLTREMLVHAMIEPAAMGSRLMAIGVAGRTMDAKLREAVVFILLNDPSLPVRLRSLEILAKYASDPAVQDALLMSLSQDPSVQIRLQALESLAGQHVGSGVIRRALGETLDENDRAVLHRAVELMGES
jgi:hypothetical protein